MPGATTFQLGARTMALRDKSKNSKDVKDVRFSTLASAQSELIDQVVGNTILWTQFTLGTEVFTTFNWFFWFHRFFPTPSQLWFQAMRLHCRAKNCSLERAAIRIKHVSLLCNKCRTRQKHKTAICNGQESWCPPNLLTGANHSAS